MYTDSPEYHRAVEARQKFVAGVLADMRAELLSAVHKCLEDGNTCGAYVYARMLARAYDTKHWLQYAALNT